MEIVLYAAPGTCGRVSAIALEEVGAAFELRAVRFLKREHKSTEFRRINPKGKVPALVVDGQVLTENVAILLYLNERYVGSGLLPDAKTGVEHFQQIADLCFCAATLHPIVTRIRVPHFFADAAAARDVWRKGCEAMREYFALVEERLRAGPWWYGDRWSVMDAYLHWVFWRVDGAGFDVGPYPNFVDHADRNEARPSIKRALEREEAMQKQLEAEGVALTLLAGEVEWRSGASAFASPSDRL